MKSIPPVDPRSRPSRGTGTLLVTGATGLLGREICRRLGEQKTRFRALVRPSSERRRLEGCGAWMIEGDLLHPESLSAALEGSRVVVHSAGLVRSSDPEANHAVHVEGTRNLLEAASTCGVRRIVAISSDTVCRERRSPYAESKAQAEELLASWASAEDRELVVLRPPMMLGRGSPHLASLERMSRIPVLPLPGSSAGRRPVWVGDVAGAVLAALELPAGALPTAPLDLPGAQRVQLGELIGAVARARGRLRPRVIGIPTQLAGPLGRLLGKGLAERLEGLGQESSADPEPAQKILNWQPLGLQETLQRCYSAEARERG